MGWFATIKTPQKKRERGVYLEGASGAKGATGGRDRTEKLHLAILAEPLRLSMQLGEIKFEGVIVLI